MSQNDSVHAWWSRLRHQGLLLSPVVLLDEDRPYHTSPARPPSYVAERLRNAHTRFQARVSEGGEGELEPSTILAWTDALLDHFVGLDRLMTLRENHVPARYTAPVRIGSGSQTLRPDRVVFADPSGNDPGAARDGRHLAPASVGVAAGPPTPASWNSCAGPATGSGC